MEIKDEWEIKLIEEARRISKHGFGEINIKMNECTRGGGERVKVVIECGCSYVYFIIKDIFSGGL